ncbi:S6 family peptidase [Salmonella enterica subsp. enterica serovar Muenchen]
MNKVFKVKRNLKKNTSVVVSELASNHVCQSIAKANVLLLLAGFLFHTTSQASIIANKPYNYQEYLDIPQNKGGHKAGKETSFQKKDGSRVHFNYPMPDFAVENKVGQPAGEYVTSKGAGTLIDSAYVGNAVHVIKFVRQYNFGDTTYMRADDPLNFFTMVFDPYDPDNPRNIGHLDMDPSDRAYIRLNKLVVDVAPVPLLPESVTENPQILMSRHRFPVFARAGGGIQGLGNVDTKIAVRVDDGYRYIVGGFITRIQLANSTSAAGDAGQMLFSLDSNSNIYPDASNVTQGDSGSPIYVYDTLSNKWYTVGVVTNAYNILRTSELDKYVKRDTDPDIHLDQHKATWNEHSIDAINGPSWKWHGINKSNPTYLANTKHLHFFGGGEVNLAQSVNLGAGALYFDNNQYYRFSAVDPLYSWIGAGLDIGEGTIVEWDIPGVAGDNLHKVGKGTLLVNAAGPGGLKAGEGLVLLNSDSEAFSNIMLTSGRGRVAINNPAAFNPDDFYFGFRGGELDLNGHDVHFNDIRHEDEGASIINSANNIVNMTLTPTEKNFLYSGKISGNISLTNNIAQNNNENIIFNGEFDIPSGDLTQSGGSLFFQGQPVIHQDSPAELVDILKNLGDDSLHTEGQRFDQPDWDYHYFRLNNINVDNVNFNVSRDASVTADINSQNSHINIGASQLWIDNLAGNTFKDGSLNFRQDLVQGNSLPTDKKDYATFNGNINAVNSTVNVTSAILNGNINADENSPVAIKNSLWNNSGINNDIESSLSLNDSEINLSSESGSKLSVNQMMASNNSFTYKINDGKTSTLILKNTPVGINNNINLIFHNKDGSPGLPWTDSILTLIKAPVDTPDDYFTLKYKSDLFDYSPALQVTQNDNVKTWDFIPSLSGINLKKNITLDHDWVYAGKLTLANYFSGVTLTHSLNEAWKPLIFGASSFDTGSSTVDLEVNTQTGQSDKVIITGKGETPKGRVSLKVNWSNQSGTSEAGTGTQAYVLAEAPENTPDSYFNITMPYAGFNKGDYTLSTYTQVNGTTRQWLLDPKRSSFEAPDNWTLSDNFFFPGTVNIDKINQKISFSDKSSEWQLHTLKAGTLSSSYNNFYIYASTLSGRTGDPLLHIDDMAEGNYNWLHFLFSGDGTPADLPASPDGLVVASAPVNTPDTYLLSTANKTDVGTYSPSFDIVKTGGEKQWVLNPKKSSFTLEKDYHLGHDWSFSGKFTVKPGVSLSLFSPSATTPDLLTIDTLSASGSNFLLAVRNNPSSATINADQIVVNTKTEGSDNTLQLQFTDEKGSPALLPFSPENSVLLARTPEETADNFFVPQTTQMAYGDYQPALRTETSGQQKMWYLDPEKSLFRLKNIPDWTLTDNYTFAGEMVIPAGTNVSLSIPESAWSPHTLTTGKLDASNNMFSLAARITPDTDVNTETDNIHILTEASGGNNPLKVQFIGNDNQITAFPASPAGLLLASAPADTASDYFTTTTTSTALGDYEPSLSVQTSGDRKQWYLDQNNALFTIKHDWALTDNTDFSGILALENNIITSLSTPTPEEEWQPHTLTVGKLSASGNLFNLYSALTADGDGNTKADRIEVITKSSGGNNLLKLQSVSDNGNIAPLPDAPVNGLVLASAPADTPDNYFTATATTTSLGEYLPSLSLNIQGDRKLWALNGENSLFTVKHNWTLDADSAFSGILSLDKDINVSLSPYPKSTESWQPHTLTIGTLAATGNEFTINTGPQNLSDSLVLTSGVQEGNTSIRVQQTKEAVSEQNPLGEWLVASAPLGVPDDYFAVTTTSPVGQKPVILATETGEKQKKWWVIAQKANTPWFLKNDRHFSELSLTDNEIALSAPVTPDWHSSSLTVDNLHANSAKFDFTVDPVNNEADQLIINNRPSGGNNLFNIHYAGYPDKTLTRAAEQLLVNAPAQTPGAFFFPLSIQTDKDSGYTQAISTIKTAQNEQWWLISMSNNAPWQFDRDRNFETLRFYQPGSTINLSSGTGNNWQPHTLSVDYLSASNTSFNLVARPQTQETDKIVIRKSATGAGNKLNVSFLLDEKQPVLLNSDLILASAPVATSDKFFTVNPVLKGLSVYKPNFATVSTGSTKEWRLLHNTEPMTALTPAKESIPMTVLTPAKESIPMTALTPAKESIPMTALTPAKESIPMTALTPAKESIPMTTLTPAKESIPMTTLTPAKESIPMTALTPAKESIPMTALTPAKESIPMTALTPAKESIPMTALTPDEEKISTMEVLPVATTPQETDPLRFFSRENNVDLIQKLNTLMMLPQIAFIEESNQLNKRLGDIRQLDDDTGFWLKTNAGRSRFEDMTIYHQTVQMGVDKKVGKNIYGVMGSYTRGYSHGQMGENNLTGGIGFYYSWITDTGPFVDVIGKYLTSRQTFSFPEKMMAQQTLRTPVLLGSVQMGWHAAFSDNRFFVEPSIEMLTGYMPGYTLQSDTVKIRAANHPPLYSKTGMAFGVNWDPDSQRQISLSAGLFRLQELRSPGKTELSDRMGPESTWTTRSNTPAEKDNRYQASLSLNARISDSWRIYSEVETSFKGILHDDYSGQIGFRYQF